MKNSAVLFVLFLLCLSCGSDSLTVYNSPETNIAVNPTLKAKLMQMSQSPTSADNIIDGTSGFAIQFPYTVTANNQTVVVSNPGGYDQVRMIFAQNSSDTDTVIIQFPITVTFADYTQAVLQDQSQFNAAKANCHPSVELSCIGFSYPMSVELYDTDSQSAQAVIIADQQQLYRFLDGIAATDVVSFNYPLTLTNPDGIPVAITDNLALEAAIDSYTDECLAGLEPTPLPEPNPNPDPTCEQVLTEGTWHVSYFFRETVQTSDYAAYDFAFNANGTALATGGSSPINGTWTGYEHDGGYKLHFVFDSSALEELDESWTVTDYTQTQITMEHESGGSGTRYLTLTRN
jgi:hypothetical protein